MQPFCIRFEHEKSVSSGPHGQAEILNVWRVQFDCAKIGLGSTKAITNVGSTRTARNMYAGFISISNFVPWVLIGTCRSQFSHDCVFLEHQLRWGYGARSLLPNRSTDRTNPHPGDFPQALLFHKPDIFKLDDMMANPADWTRSLFEAGVLATSAVIPFSASLKYVFIGTFLELPPNCSDRIISVRVEALAWQIAAGIQRSVSRQLVVPGRS